MALDVLVWGASGQAKVLRPMIEARGGKVVALVDGNENLPSPFGDVPRFSGWKDLEVLLSKRRGLLSFVVAIGRIGRDSDRVEISQRLLALGCEPLTLIHSTAWIAETVKLGNGCQIMGRAAVSEEAEIGDWCILNTNCSVDHDTRLGRGVHVMPGATISGCVEVGECAAIGSNATILPRVRIGNRAVVGAGAVVTRDVEAGMTVVGVPAKPIRKQY